MSAKIDTVLLVDDDYATNFITKKVVANANVAEHIEISLNGKEAIQFIKNRYHSYTTSVRNKSLLILLDINMPVMDGWEFLDEYHKLDESQKEAIIIVMLSSSLNPDDRKRAESYKEVSGFRTKMLTKEAFDELVNDFFSD